LVLDILTKTTVLKINRKIAKVKMVGLEYWKDHRKCWQFNRCRYWEIGKSL